MSLVEEALATWKRPRARMRARLDQAPPEASLLVWVDVASLVGFVAGLPNAFEEAARLDTPDATTAVLTGRLFGAIFVTPLALYCLSLLAFAGLRAAGCDGSLRDMRIVLFWAVLCAAPLVLANAILGVILTVAHAPAQLAAAAAFATSVAFLWIWSAGISEAGGIRQTRHVFVTIFVILSGTTTAVYWSSG